MTSEYSVNFDWHDELSERFENWQNESQRVIRGILEDQEHEKFKEVAKSLDMLKDDGTLEDHWEEFENDFEPMMNYAYPLHHSPSDEEILELSLKTSCTVMYKDDTDESFLVLNGGGMDLSQSIAHAYMICGYIPDALAFNVSTQYGLNISGEDYFKVMGAIKESLENTIEAYKYKIDRINQEVEEAKKEN